jgi:hypothetical protein
LNSLYTSNTLLILLLLILIMASISVSILHTNSSSKGTFQIVFLSLLARVFSGLGNPCEHLTISLMIFNKSSLILSNESLNTT